MEPAKLIARVPASEFIDPGESARFYTADEALKYAFGLEAQQIRPGSFYGEQAGGGSGLSPFDLITDGLLLKNSCLAVLGVRGVKIVEAYYTVPVPDLEDKKNEAMSIAAKWVCWETDRPLFFLNDTVRDWAGQRMHHDYRWWAKHLRRSTSTVHCWTKGRNSSDKSSAFLLDGWMNLAMDRVTDFLREKGHLI